MEALSAIFDFIKRKKISAVFFSNSLSSKPWIRIRIRIHNTENNPRPLLLLASMTKTELSLSRTVYVGDSWLFLKPFFCGRDCATTLPFVKKTV
jgi:hypothetical protein